MTYRYRLLGSRPLLTVDDYRRAARRAPPAMAWAYAEALRGELHRTLVLMGCHDVRDLDRSRLVPSRAAEAVGGDMHTGNP